EAAPVRGGGLRRSAAGRTVRAGPVAQPPTARSADRGKYGRIGSVQRADRAGDHWTGGPGAQCACISASWVRLRVITQLLSRAPTVAEGGSGQVTPPSTRVGGVTREEVGGGVDHHRGVVHGRGRFAKPGRDQPYLAWVLGDVFVGEHPWQ